MGNARIISVNPGAKSLGASNPDMLKRLARGYRNATPEVSVVGPKAFADFIFGINRNVSSVWSGKLLGIRLLIGALLIVSALMSGVDFHYLLFSNVQLVVGIMFIVGLFERMAALVGIAFYLLFFIWDSHLIVANNTTEIVTAILHSTEILFVVLLIVGAVVGPGRYSIDQLMRRSIVNRIKTSEAQKQAIRRQKEADARLSYKAYMANDGF